MYSSLIRCIMLGFSIKFKGIAALNPIIIGNYNTVFTLLVNATMYFDLIENLWYVWYTECRLHLE